MRVLQKYVSHYQNQGEAVSMISLGIPRLETLPAASVPSVRDALLEALGSRLRQRVRAEDLVGRDEAFTFTVAMVCEVSPALKISQRLMAAVQQEPFHVHEGMCSIEISAGVSGVPLHGSTPRQLWLAARKANKAACEEPVEGACLLFEEAMYKEVEPAVSKDAF